MVIWNQQEFVNELNGHTDLCVAVVSACMQELDAFCVELARISPQPEHAGIIEKLAHAMYGAAAQVRLTRLAAVLKRLENEAELKQVQEQTQAEVFAVAAETLQQLEQFIADNG